MRVAERVALDVGFELIGFRVVLRDIEGLSTAQAAAVMQLGEAAFKSRLHRARLAVREAIEDYLDVEDTA